MERMRGGARRIGCAVVIAVLGGAAVLGGTAQAATGRAARPAARGATDPSASAAAKQATVALADLGAGWTRYRKASGFEKTDAKNCNTRFGSPLRASDRGYNGAMLTDTAKQSFVYSYAFVFRTKAGAKAYTAARNARSSSSTARPRRTTPRRRRRRERIRPTYVRVVQGTDPAIGGPRAWRPSTSRRRAVKAADGTDSVGASYARYTYRHGRVVTVVLVDTGPVADAAASQERRDAPDRRAHRGFPGDRRPAHQARPLTASDLGSRRRGRCAGQPSPDRTSRSVSAARAARRATASGSSDSAKRSSPRSNSISRAISNMTAMVSGVRPTPARSIAAAAPARSRSVARTAASAIAASERRNGTDCASARSIVVATSRERLVLAPDPPEQQRAHRAHGGLPPCVLGQRHRRVARSRAPRRELADALHRHRTGRVGERRDRLEVAPGARRRPRPRRRPARRRTHR